MPFLSCCHSQSLLVVVACFANYQPPQVSLHLHLCMVQHAY